jgi:hypothetical protein
MSIVGFARLSRKRSICGDGCSTEGVEYDASPGGLALLAAIVFFSIALVPPDLLAGAIAYLREGRYTFRFRTLHATTVAAMFAFIIATRSLLVWRHARWAKRRQIFSVRVRYFSLDERHA